MKFKYLLFLLVPFLSFSQVQVGETIYGEAIDNIFHNFGLNVSSSADGTFIAVGSPSTAVNSGSVKVYENISDVWTQIGNTIDGELNERIGTTISLSSDGSILAVGSGQNSEHDVASGQVRVYRNMSGIWSQIGSDISGNLARSYLGRSVNLSSDGTILAIGVPIDNPNFPDTKGRVLVYKYDNDEWIQIGSNIEGEVGTSNFGNTVRLSADGSILAVEYFNKNKGTANIGVYEYNNGIWSQIGESIRKENTSYFKTDVKTLDLSTDGNTVIYSSNQFTGVYKNISGVWIQTNEGNPLFSSETSSVGISLNGNIVAVGEFVNSEKDETTGQVRIYENNGGIWSQIGENINGENIGDSFGYALSLSSDGSNITVGSPFNFNNGTGSGQVQVFENISGTWTQVGDDLNGDLGISSRSIGESVSLSSDGKTLATGGITYDSFRGIVKVYEDINGTWIQKGDDIIGDYYYNRFGKNVSLSADGNVIAINEPGKDINGFNTGQVKVFNYENGMWLQIGDALPNESQGSGYQNFIGLSSDGSVLAVGINGSNSTNFGHIRIYKNENNNWTQIGEDLEGMYTGDLGNFNISMSLNASVLAVGMPSSRKDNKLYGHVRIYKNINDVWTQVGEDIGGDIRYMSFGNSVSLSTDGNIVAIEARDYRNTDGSRTGQQIKIYRNSSDTWLQVGETIYTGGSPSLSNDDNIKLNGDGSILVAKSFFLLKAYKNSSEEWSEIIDLSGDNLFSPNSSISLASNLPVISISNPFTNNNGGVKIYNFEREDGRAEVIDDIKGNGNGFNITARQLNAISGVSGAIEGINYSEALNNGVFTDENNPTALEIQTIINTVNASLGIEDNSLANFNIYPNPVKNILNIELNQGLKLNQINIYNLQSQYLYSVKTSKIDVSKLSSGLYFIEVETKQGKSVKKIVIE